MSSWGAIAGARTRPADVVPGLLAQSVRAAGGHVGYVGRAARNREAAVAADRSGRVERVALAAPDVAEARAPLGAHRSAGREAAARGRPAAGSSRGCSRARGAADLVLVIQDPSRITRRLVAMARPACRAAPRSTRLDPHRGLVSSTDIAPTVLERLGLDVPDEMSGKAIEARGDATPGGALGAAQPAHRPRPAPLGGDLARA